MPLNAPTRTVADFSPSAQGYVRNAQSGLWVPPTPTPQPLSYFDASNPNQALDSDGILTWNANSKVNEEIPGSGGLRGFRFRFNGNPDPENDVTSEARYNLSVPLSVTYEHMRIWQPANYFHRAFFSADSVENISTLANWAVGDAIECNGRTAVIRYIKDVNGRARIFVNETSVAYVEWIFPVSATVTNQRNNETFTVQARGNPSSVNKLSTMYSGYYDLGAYTYQTYGQTTDNLGNSFLKPDSVATESTPSLPIGNELGDAPKIMDTAQNGSYFDIVIGRGKASAAGANDGFATTWRKPQGGNWSMIQHDSTVDNFTTEYDNKFTGGFVHSYSNSGFTDTTDIHMMIHSVWPQRPTFLPSGV